MLTEMLVVGTFWFWMLILAEFCFLIWCLEYEKYIVAPVTLVVLAVVFILFGTGVRDIGTWMWENKLWTAIYAGGYVVAGTIYAVVKWWLFVHDQREVNRDFKRDWLGNWKQTAQNLAQQVAGYKDVLAQTKVEADRWERELSTARERGDKDKMQQAEYRLAQANGQIEQYTKQIADNEALPGIWEASQGQLTADLLPLWKNYERSTYHRDWFGRSIPIVKPEPENFKGRIIAWVGYWPPSFAWTVLNDPLRRIGRAVYNMIAKLLRMISDSAWRDEDTVV